MIDFKPTASIEMLRKRSDMMMAVHQFFQQRDFIHVETPLLSHDTVVDQHIDPVPVAKSSVTGRNEPEQMWLQTSPEFCMKRMVAGGATHIYQIAKAFRQAESGRRHNPEFTMLEWYRVGDDMHAGMELLSQFASSILNRPPCKMISYRAAFEAFAGLDPFKAPVQTFVECCQAKDIPADFRGEASNRRFWQDYVLTMVIEPKLGFAQPVIIYDWPADQSALAIVRSEEAFPVAERFELYVDGVELANGYHELIDAAELESRNATINQQRQRDGTFALPSESRLLDAMRSGMPACSGVAVGFDRLMMVAHECEKIEDVIAFPIDRA